METIKCKACGSNDIVVQDGYYVCQYCGTKSLLESRGKHSPQKQIPILPKNYVCPEGAINGLFSVGPNEWVLFSKGNLQYQASTSQWQFAEHQYGIIGEADKNEDWDDLFDWETGTTRGKISGTWFALSIEQWGYILKKRCVASDMRFVKAQVAGVNGLVLLPDNWDANRYILYKVNRGEAAYVDNIISAEEWETLFQAHGAVFLPAAGRRDEAKVIQAGNSGFYWSSTAGSFGRANCMLFDNTNLDPSDGKSRSNGYSVRLVCPVKR